MTEKILQNKLDRFIERKLNIKDGEVVHCDKCNSMTLKVKNKEYYAYCPTCKERLFVEETYSTEIPARDDILHFMKGVEK